MTKSRFKEILRNIDFFDNDTAGSNDEDNKVRSLIDHFNETFQNALANSSNQTFDEHMIKFKGRLSINKYIKSKSIKWGFKFWFPCDSKTGYFCELDVYLGRKESAEYNLGDGESSNILV